MSDKLTETQWIEIATVAFFVSLIGWIVKNATTSAYAPVQSQELPVSVPTVSVPAAQSVTLAPVSLPVGAPLPNAGGNGSCGGCSNGSVPSSVAQIVANANAAIAQMNQASKDTLNYLAQIGNQEQSQIGDTVYYVVG